MYLGFFPFTPAEVGVVKASWKGFLRELFAKVWICFKGDENGFSGAWLAACDAIILPLDSHTGGQ